MRNISKNSKAALSVLAASLMMICAGCAQRAQTLSPLDRDLPPRPSEVSQAVPVPPLAKGDDARARLAQTRTALKEANARIICGADWYDDVAHQYRGEVPDRPVDPAECVRKARRGQ